MLTTTSKAWKDISYRINETNPCSSSSYTVVVECQCWFQTDDFKHYKFEIVVEGSWTVKATREKIASALSAAAPEVVPAVSFDLRNSCLERLKLDVTLEEAGVSQNSVLLCTKLNPSAFMVNVNLVYNDHKHPSVDNDSQVSGGTTSHRLTVRVRSSWTVEAFKAMIASNPSFTRLLPARAVPDRLYFEAFNSLELDGDLTLDDAGVTQDSYLVCNIVPRPGNFGEDEGKEGKEDEEERKVGRACTDGHEASRRRVWLTFTPHITVQISFALCTRQLSLGAFRRIIDAGESGLAPILQASALFEYGGIAYPLSRRLLSKNTPVSLLYVLQGDGGSAQCRKRHVLSCCLGRGPLHEGEATATSCI